MNMSANIPSKHHCWRMISYAQHTNVRTYMYINIHALCIFWYKIGTMRNITVLTISMWDVHGCLNANVPRKTNKAHVRTWYVCKHANTQIGRKLDVNVLMYACIHTHTHTHTHTKDVCEHANIWIGTLWNATSPCTHTYIPTYIHAHSHVCKHAKTRTRSFGVRYITCMYVCMHACYRCTTCTVSYVQHWILTPDEHLLACKSTLWYVVHTSIWSEFCVVAWIYTSTQHSCTLTQAHTCYLRTFTPCKSTNTNIWRRAFLCGFNIRKHTTFMYSYTRTCYLCTLTQLHPLLVY